MSDREDKPHRTLGDVVPPDGGHLGIYLGHDAGVALVRPDGSPFYIGEESKFCGYKSPFFHPVWSLQALAEAGVTEVSSLTWAMPREVAPDSALVNFFGRLQALRPRILAHLAKLLSWGEERFLPHHLAHGAGALYSSPFDRALVLVVDGSGEDESLTVYLGDRAAAEPLELVERLATRDFSYGSLYDKFTGFLGYRSGRVADHCGKIMGLSSYGNPRYVNFLSETLRAQSGPYPAWPPGFNRTLVEKFGTPFPRPTTTYTQEQADVAASLQLFLEEELLALLARLRAAHPDYNNLCFSGGVGMNSLFSGRVLDRALFDGLFVSPVASDTGLAYGAAVHTAAATRSGRETFSPVWHVAYHGYRHHDDEEELKSILDAYDLGVRVVTDYCPPEEVARLICDGRIVAVHRGRQEVGARALGNRSILTLPSAAHRDRVNGSVKYREPWRPFAPMVKEEATGKYFVRTRPEPFMTTIYPVAEEFRNALDGITHVDGTARLQTVSRFQNGWIYRILDALETTGRPPVILNTSFNVDGQSIVRTVYDAVMTFLSSGIDDLVVGDALLTKTHAAFPVRKQLSIVDRVLEKSLRSACFLDVISVSPRQETLATLNHLLALPSLVNRRSEKTLTLGTFSSHPSIPAADWEVMGAVGSRFARVEYGVGPRPERHGDTVLLVAAGSPHLAPAAFHGRITDPAPETAPDRKFLSGLKNRAAAVFLVDDLLRVYPLDYYLDVVAPSGDAPRPAILEHE